MEPFQRSSNFMKLPEYDIVIFVKSENLKRKIMMYKRIQFDRGRRHSIQGIILAQDTA